MRYFALVACPGWVEIRRARLVPKYHTSSTKFLSIQPPRPWARAIPRTVQTVLTVHRFKGGRMVKSMKLRNFTTRTGIVLQPGTIVELPAPTLKKVGIVVKPLDKRLRLR